MAPAALRALGAAAALLLTARLLPDRAVAEGTAPGTGRLSIDYAGDLINLEQFDFIVVGAGSAGSVVADRLSEWPALRVLVVDAGGDPPYESVTPALFPYLPRTRCDWNFTSENDDYTAQSHAVRALNLTSGRVLGGGSSLNYMMYVRGCAGDYDAWARALRDDAWSYRRVLPYFMRSERLLDAALLGSPHAAYHGTDGFLGVTRENRPETVRYLQAFGEAGHDVVLDVNGGSGVGYTLPLYTIADGVRQTTALTNLGANGRRANLHVLKNTLVTEILFDRNDNAIGVKATTADDRELTLLARKEVVVSAGALNTPKLLMLSGIGPREHLRALGVPVRSDLPVGTNLQDHAAVVAAFKMERSSAPPPPQDPRLFPFPSTVGYATLDRSRSCPEYQTFNFIVPGDSEAPYRLCAFNIGLEESLCRKLLEAGRGRNTMFSYIVILHPESRGRVRLRSRDPSDPPVVDLGTFSKNSDLEELASYLRDYVRVINSTYFRSVGAEMVDLGVAGCAHLPFASRRYWRCYALRTVTTMFHYAGSAAMGPVLDARLRVRRVRRLRVADASAMPALPGGNTNAPAVMIGERAADFIKEELAADDAYSSEFHKYFRFFT